MNIFSNQVIYLASIFVLRSHLESLGYHINDVKYKGCVMGFGTDDELDSSLVCLFQDLFNESGGIISFWFNRCDRGNYHSQIRLNMCECKLRNELIKDINNN